MGGGGNKLKLRTANKSKTEKVRKKSMMVTRDDKRTMTT